MRVYHPRQSRAFLATVTLVLATAIYGEGLVNQIRVNIVVQDEAAHDHAQKAGGKGVAGAAEKKSEHLEITLQNASPNNFEDVTVRYYIFGEKIGEKEKEITLASKGEQVLTIPPSGKLTITSEVASVTHTPAHETGGGGAKNAKAATVKARGEKFAGYGARVEKDGVMLGQYFDPLDLTNHLDAAVDGAKKGNKKAPAPKKKA